MWTPEQTSEGVDLVWSQPEFGIAPSALKGNANLQNVNIATEPGQVMASFTRENQAQAELTAQTLTPDGDSLFDAPAGLKSGTWIKVTASTVTSITAESDPAPTTAAIDYLVVGGGGQGGNAFQHGAGGGGGAGQVIDSNTTIGIGSIPITIGRGGSKNVGAALQKGENGQSTVFGSIATAIGGGGGGLGTQNVSPNTRYDGADGGSGGGGGAGQTDSGNGGTGTAGFDGGDGLLNASISSRAGGGGGGAGSAGANALGVNDGGDGGDGVTKTISGRSQLYATGGGGSNGGLGGSGNAGGGRGSAGTTTFATAGTVPGAGGGGEQTTTDVSRNGAAGAAGIVIVSYTTGSMVAIGGEVSFHENKTIHTFTEDGVLEVLWINPGGYYYVSYKDSSDKVKLSTAYDPYGTDTVTHGTTGSITFETVATPGKPIAKATEKYQTTTDTEYRYYLLDDSGRVWVYDTQVYASTLASNGVGVTWQLPDPNDYSSVKPKGIGVLNGWLFLLTTRRILCKPTVLLGAVPSFMKDGWMTNPYDTHPLYAYTGSQGTLLYTDGNFIGEIFPTTSLITSIANLQSYCSFTATTTKGTIATLIGGSIPSHENAVRVPAVFFSSPGGSIATALTPNKVYYIQYSLVNSNFEVYVNLTGGSALNIETGATGTQYFNTFYPIGSNAGSNGTNPTLQFSSQRVNLPFYEIATRLLEIGNTILIGCKGNIMYPWNQVDAVPSDVITLPEDNVTALLNVNNTAYVFAGNKGNIYITNLSVASVTLKIPDYLAGVPGTPNSYIEPTFTWGDAIYIRGRVYCSILDQTAVKAGNCGGMFSFIPSENTDFSQEVGMALRLENQNSYGTYNGYAPILINDRQQVGKSPKYWAAWQDSYDDATANFGIDYSTDNPVTGYVIETDLLPTGTMLQKQTFEQLEYKLAVPLAAGESVQLYWRTDPTGAWTSAGTAEVETTYPVSGYYRVNFEKTQWVQIRAEATTTGNAATSTFVPLTQIRIR